MDEKNILKKLKQRGLLIALWFALGCEVYSAKKIYDNNIEQQNHPIESILETQTPISFENNLDSYEFETALHNSVINNNNQEFVDDYLEFENYIDFSFYDDCSDYIQQDLIISNIENLSYTINYEPDGIILGTYNNSKNEVMVVEAEEVMPRRSVFAHEMMHFLSNGGFSNKYLQTLNESITEMLARGYGPIVGENNNKYESYFNYVIPFIELVGKDYILETYFSNNDVLLIEEISKYTDNYENLILEMDYLSKNIHEYESYLDGNIYDEEIVQKYKVFLEDYWNIISEMYQNKYSKDIHENNLFNYYMIQGKIENASFCGIENGSYNDFKSSYNPIVDDYFILCGNSVRYDVGKDGITYTISNDINNSIVRTPITLENDKYR